MMAAAGGSNMQLGCSSTSHAQQRLFVAQQRRALSAAAAVQRRLLAQQAPRATARHDRRSRPRRLLPAASAAAAGGAGAAGGGQPAAAPSAAPIVRACVLGWLPSAASLQLVTDAWRLLSANLVALLVVFLAKDAAAFVLYRVMHRITNCVAELALGVPISSWANPWWIVADAKFMEGHAGYQVLVGVAFLLALPLNILLNTAAVSTATAVCVARAAALHGPGVPTASFTGQGRGKVGLADYPRPPSTVSSYDDDADLPSSSMASVDGASVDGAATAAAAAAKLAQMVAASSSRGGGSGAASFARGAPACVTFRSPTPGGASSSSSSLGGAAASAGAESSSSTSSSTNSSSSSQRRAAGAATPPQRLGPRSGSSSPVPPEPAPALPWLTVVQERSKPPPRLGLRASLAAIREAWRGQVAPQLRALWGVDVAFNVWALPLQAACLAVLPAFWAFPRLLRIQLALPAAQLGGEAGGRAALQASRGLMAGYEAAYAWPFVWLIVGGRLVEVAREVVLLAMPNRWWTEVAEVPLAASAAFFAARLLLLRVQDLLPLAAYMTLTQQQAQQQQQLQGAA